MKCVVFYDPVDTPGQILKVKMFEDGQPTTDYDAATPAGADWLVDATALASPDIHYVNLSGSPTLAARPAVVADETVAIETDGIDEVRFALPAGTVVTFDFDDTEYTVATAQDFVFTTTIVGVWSFHIDPPFPYQPAILEIDSSAAV